MRNTLLDPFEDLPRAVVVTANDYAAGSVFPDHAHRRVATHGHPVITPSHHPLTGAARAGGRHGNGVA